MKEKIMSQLSINTLKLQIFKFLRIRSNEILEQQ